MMTDMGTIVVTGATGRQGGATARRLLAGGHQVRALVRDTASPAATALEKAGAELVFGEMDDPASLVPALTGAYGVFIVPPATYEPRGADSDVELRRTRTVIDAAVEAGVEQAVFTGIGSFSGPAAELSSGKQQAEQYLWESGLGATVLRPVRFMTNFLGTGVGVDDIHDGVSRHVFPADEPVQLVAVEDIAEFATLAFTAPDSFGGRTLELAGDALTPNEAFTAINSATGLDLRYAPFSEAEAAALGPEVAKARRLWGAGHRWHADIEALRVIHPGLRTLHTWLSEGGADLLRTALERR